MNSPRNFSAADLGAFWKLKPCHAKQGFYGSVLCSPVCATAHKLVLHPEDEVTEVLVNESFGVDKSEMTLEWQEFISNRFNLERWERCMKLFWLLSVETEQ